MAEDGATVREWTDIVRRARLGRTTKLIALLLANYADADGTRVFPGVARVSIEAEVTYNVVKTALAALRQAGLIKVVRRATRKGDSDEYRLTIGPDLLEHVEVLSPEQISKAMVAVRENRRGGVRQKGGPDGPGARPTERAVQDAPAQPTPWAADASARPTERAVQEIRTAHGVTPKTIRTAHGVVQHGPRRYPPPTTTETQELPTTPEADLRTAVTVVARGPDQDPIIHRLSSKCMHGLTARLLPGGTSSCALCRHEAHLADPNVIPIRRNA